MMPFQMSGDQDSFSTRPSLLRRLKRTDDQQGWQEFNDLYRGLIFRFAIKAGLSETEAEEVVQETMIAAAKHLPAFEYNPKTCSFKTWLLNLTHWRVKNQIRNRHADKRLTPPPVEDGDRTATIERLPGENPLEQLWDQEWQQALLSKAIQKAKSKVDPKQWQVFDLHALKEWSVPDVSKTLKISPARIYLIKHRIQRLLQKERARLEGGTLRDT
jgi:RNA polymerase sigma factor (sigma-70 family)